MVIFANNLNNKMGTFKENNKNYRKIKVLKKVKISNSHCKLTEKIRLFN